MFDLIFSSSRAFYFCSSSLVVMWFLICRHIAIRFVFIFALGAIALSATRRVIRYLFAAVCLVVLPHVSFLVPLFLRAFRLASCLFVTFGVKAAVRCSPQFFFVSYRCSERFVPLPRIRLLGRRGVGSTVLLSSLRGWFCGSFVLIFLGDGYYIRCFICSLLLFVLLVSLLLFFRCVIHYSSLQFICYC